MRFDRMSFAGLRTAIADYQERGIRPMQQALISSRFTRNS
jgi:hypothetical protein